MFARIISSITCAVKSAFSVNIFDPGCSPYIVRLPSRIAVTESPGRPKVSIVVIAPPITPLFAADDTAKPSTEPWPYLSPSLENFFELPQQITAEISPPAAGIAPTIVATSETMIVRGIRASVSFNGGSTRPSARLCLRCS